MNRPVITLAALALLTATPGQARCDELVYDNTKFGPIWHITASEIGDEVTLVSGSRMVTRLQIGLLSDVAQTADVQVRIHANDRGAGGLEVSCGRAGSSTMSISSAGSRFLSLRYRTFMSPIRLLGPFRSRIGSVIASTCRYTHRLPTAKRINGRGSVSTTRGDRSL